MYPQSTLPRRPRVVLHTCWAGWLFLAAGLPVVAQSLPSLRPEWRRIGSSAVELDLPAPATGPVTRVWYSPDGVRLLALSVSGRVFETADFETWKEAAAVAPPSDAAVVSPLLPEPSARLRQPEGRAGRLYAVASSAWRSDDGGSTWSNLTSFRTRPLLGVGVKDLAVSPQNPDDIIVATATGVWRSLDGGLAWDGLNDSLPNLPVRKLLASPLGSRGLRLSVDFGSGPEEVEWVPGEKRAWRTTDGSLVRADQAAKSQWSAATGLRVTAVASAASMLYLGTADGLLITSSDQGATWSRQRVAGGASVEGLFVDPAEPRTALAALSNRSSGRILRTTNAGLYWDDLTANLPVGRAHGVTADIRSGALYAATDSGVFYTQANLTVPAPATTWVSLSAALPGAPAADVSLDASGNRLYVALEGYGVYATLPPHRYRDLRLVSAADYRARAAAPGSLLSVLGTRITGARLGDVTVPVLAAAETESQIQVPFEASGNSLLLSLQSANGASAFGLPLRRASPAIFVDRDNTPLLLNADSGVLLDSMSPAHAGARVQILATGLGGVKPVWPTGMPAPLENPPAVALPVRALLDRAPLEVTRATLAPGYVGFYLVEVQLPDMVNAGPSELYLEADGQESNRVRIWLAP